MENTDPNNLDREPNDSLLLSYIKGTATASEKASVEAWIAENAENEKTVRQLGKIYFAQRTHERISSRDPQVAFEKVQKRINGKMRRIWVQRFVVAAACLVSVVFLLKITTRTQQPLQQQQAQLITVEANPGMRTHIHLPDGTMAYLNSGSTLTYTIPFDAKERKVAL
ncbi:MAG: anti-sigma factor, partial [Porphyromonadaceae bacterium]|nr:anti-sigma factor [Porphyromonadaceae bacterium]